MYYVAYGSNMNLEQMEYRCPDAELIGTGFINGYQLMFRGNPYSAVATIQIDRTSRKDTSEGVPCVVWDISKRDEESLDIYEGYPNLYKKDTVTVTMSDGRKLDCMVYIMSDLYKVGIPSERYLNTILNGYQENDIDPIYLFERVEKMSKGVKPNSD